MRHWIGLGLAIALAAALFFGAGWGVTRMSALPAEGLSLTSNRGLSALGALSGVGLLLGILIAAPRISPLAAGLPGLVLLAWTALLGMSGTLAVKLIPLKQAPSGAGFHALNYSMFDLARGYAAEGMPAYVRLQDAEFAAESRGYTATRHQREVGTGYFDLVTSAITPDASTVALSGSTESEQFSAAH